MENILEILKIILPAVITGISTFLITKYTYNKNRPLDKLEVAYNRVYYPLYRLVCNNSDIDLIIDKSKIYFDKYDKYVDGSTLRAYDFLCECDTSAKKKTALSNFKNNIYDRNSYLRRRLGYLEPSIFKIYTYSSSNDKFKLRILFEVLAAYLFIFASQLFRNKQSFFIYAVVLFVFFILVELLIKLFMFIYYKIRK